LHEERKIVRRECVDVWRYGIMEGGVDAGL
jgi:hypothetical protein